MKILVLHSPSFPLYDKISSGGCETLTVGICESLKALNYDFCLAATSDSTITKYNFIKIDNPSKKVLHRDFPGKNYQYSKGYDEIIKRLPEFDLIISISTFQVIKYIRKNSNIKIIHFVHEPPSFPSNKIELEILNSMKNLKVLSNSKNTLNGYIKQNCTADMEVFPLTFFESLIKPNFSKTNNLVFLGRLVKIRNPYLIIKAASTLLQDYNFTFIGAASPHKAEQEYLKDCFELAKHCHNVKFMGGDLTNDEVHTIVANSDALLNLRHNEGFGLSSFESLKLGTPVIFETKSSPGSVSEFCVDGLTGFNLNTYNKSQNYILKSFEDIVKIKLPTINKKDVYNYYQNNYNFADYYMKLDFFIKEMM